MTESTAEHVLSTLRRAGAEGVSGSKMADETGISRTAVWKTIAALRAQGFDIRGIPNKGYTLVRETDQLSEEAVRCALSKRWRALDVRCFGKTDSTNTQAKLLLVAEKKPYLIAAVSQTAGRGRRGRSFYSPGEGCGLYFSLALPWNREEAPTLATTMTAVAVCRALETLYGLDPKIKWVNDIFLDGKKVCGILTEGTVSLETGEIDALIVGVGINLFPPENGYPEAIRAIACSVSDSIAVKNSSGVSSDEHVSSTKDPAEGETTYVCDLGNSGEAKDVLLVSRNSLSLNRNFLLAEVVNQLGVILDALPKRQYLEAYRKRCFVLGRSIRLDDGRVIVPHTISDSGELVFIEDGCEERVSTGEVHII